MALDAYTFDTLDVALATAPEVAVLRQSGTAFWAFGTVAYTYPESQAFMDLANDSTYPAGEAGEIVMDLEEPAVEYPEHPMYYYFAGGRLLLQAFPMRSGGFDLYETNPRLSNPGVNYLLNRATQKLTAQEVKFIALSYTMDDNNWPRLVS